MTRESNCNPVQAVSEVIGGGVGVADFRNAVSSEL